MKLHKLYLVIPLFLFSELSSAHIRMVNPLSRSTSDASKQDSRNPGPCGGVAINPSIPTLQLVGGSQLPIDFNETIRHDGRFKVQWSISGQDNFASQTLAVKQNTPAAGGAHRITVTVPDIDCPSCIIRVIQEMDDQPTQLYTQCIDSKITKSAPTPVDDGGVGSQSSGSQKLPEMSGCGLVASQWRDSNGGGPTTPVAMTILLLFPAFVVIGLRRSHRIEPTNSKQI